MAARTPNDAVARGRIARIGPMPVSTRAASYYAGLSNGTDTSTTFRVVHHATADAVNVCLVYGNFYGNAAAQQVGPNNITVKAGIGTPDGNIYPVYFKGSRTAVIEPGGLVVSDPVGCVVARGDVLNTRTYVSVTAGQQWPLGVRTVSGNSEGNNGATGADATLSGSIANADAYAYSPMVLLGQPTSPVATVGFIGDSIISGQGDAADQGFLWRALSEQFGVVKISQPSEQANDFAFPPIQQYRARLFQWMTHAVCEYGINDMVISGRSLATIQASLVTIWTALHRAGVKTWQTTLCPNTTSTDSWATVGNQTVKSFEATRTSLNDWIRDGAPLLAGVATTTGTANASAYRAGTYPHPLNGYYETADQVESARNSGKWKAAYTADGTHPTGTAHAAMATAITTTDFTV